MTREQKLWAMRDIDLIALADKYEIKVDKNQDKEKIIELVLEYEKSQDTTLKDV